MICNYCCKREAAFFIEQSTKDSSKRLHICMECAVKNGISPDPQRVQYAINSLFKTVAQEIKKRSAEEETLCPGCGKSLAAIKHSFSAGCPECYDVFKKEINELLTSHGFTGSYTGSMPRNLASFRSSLMDKVNIETKLKISIQNEDYEKAAMYRDYLRSLERQPVSDGENHSK